MDNWQLTELIYSDFLLLVDNKILISEIRKFGCLIKYVKNPSKKLQLVAVKSDIWSIEYIKNPCVEAQLIAVNGYGLLIEYISSPNKEVQLAAVSQNGHSIKNIKNPSKEVQLKAINNFSHEASFIIYCLKKITEFSVLLKLYDMVKNPVSKEHIKKSPYWKDDANLILEKINS